MKKITWLLLAAVWCLPAFAANNKKNTMKMVSYFPVPYVAYDNVSANQSIDVGLLNKCEMSLGPGTSNVGGSNCSLYLWGDKAGNDLKRGLLNVTSGTLMLNSGGITNPLIKSEKVLVGSGGTAGTGWLDIGRPGGKGSDVMALYITSIANKGNSLRVTGNTNRGNDVAAKVDSFKMFDQIRSDFPTDCNGEATWQAAELGGDESTNKTFTDIYLICNGTGGATPPDPDEPCQPTNGVSYTEECPDGSTGKITHTWNYNSCSYVETSTCMATCTWKAGSWSTTGLTSSQAETCYDTRPYSYKYFDAADVETQKQNAVNLPGGKSQCTDWILSAGYNGQRSAQSNPPSAPRSCPTSGTAQGSCYESEPVCQNMGGEYSVYFDRFLYNDPLSYLVTNPSSYSCNMGGPSNTVFACNLPNGNVAYACYNAQVRTIACTK